VLLSPLRVIYYIPVGKLLKKQSVRKILNIFIFITATY